MKTDQNIGLDTGSESKSTSCRCSQNSNYFSYRAREINEQLNATIIRLEQKIELLRQIYDSYKNEEEIRERTFTNYFRYKT